MSLYSSQYGEPSSNMKALIRFAAFSKLYTRSYSISCRSVSASGSGTDMRSTERSVASMGSIPIISLMERLYIWGQLLYQVRVLGHAEVLHPAYQSGEHLLLAFNPPKVASYISYAPIGHSLVAV